MNEKKAVVLLSGGLDSATCLAIAKSEGFAIHTLTFSYGQRHKVELDCARRLAEAAGVVKHHLISFDLREWGGSVQHQGETHLPHRPRVRALHSAESRLHYDEGEFAD